MKIYAHWKKVKVQKGKIKKVTAKKKKLIIKYNSIEDVYSYTIQVSTKKTFKSKYTKNYSAKKENISKKVKVKKKGMYYVRIRGEKKDSFGNIIHGKWSAVKKVKVK